MQKLILAIVPLGLLHHVDHVLRGDHSSWPFRPELGPFTFTLLIYPVLAAAFLPRPKAWVRVGGLGVVSLFTLLAHTLIEPPAQIYGMWAYNLSSDAPLYTIDPEHMHTLLNLKSPLLGVRAALLSIVLTGILMAAWLVAIRDARHSRLPPSRH